LIASFASTESGRAGNDWGGGDCPSILFKALRMELNFIVPYSIHTINLEFSIKSMC